MLANRRDQPDAYDVGKFGGARYAGQPVRANPKAYADARREQRGGNLFQQIGTGTIFDPREREQWGQPTVGRDNR